MNSHLFFRLSACILDAVRALKQPASLPLERCILDACKDPTHGELASNAAMVLAKPAGMPPRKLADLLVPLLLDNPDIATAEVAGPGFINIRLHPDVWRAEIPVILKAGTRYGDSDLGQGIRVNLEYVSANPTGPMHVGHARGAVFGDALANLLAKTGHNVTREYYINDAGAQVDVLARSACLRYREALGETVTIPDGLYPGEYLKAVGQAIASSDGGKWRDAPESQWLPVFRDRSIAMMMDLIRDDLAALGIRHDVFTSESALVRDGAVETAISRLEQQDLLYTGTLEPPKGQLSDDWEARPQRLFRSTAFGDDADRAIQKPDGSWTYFAGDIACHADKLARGFDKLINVWGADHGGYVKRMQAVVTALSGGKVSLDVRLVQLVQLFQNGQPYKMSKRAGTFVTARDMVDEVGKDALRFMMLTRRNDAPLDFDVVKVLEQTRDNPVFYVQYAHARTCSVFRQATETMGNVDLARADLSLLADPAELDVVRLLAAWPREVEVAANLHEPHRLTTALGDIAASFHALWNKGREETQLRFIDVNDSATTLVRLALVKAVQLVLASGLAVLGVTPVEEMR